MMCEIDIEVKQIFQKKLMSGELVTDEPHLHQLNMKQKRLTAIYRIVEKMQSRNAKLHEIDSR